MTDFDAAEQTINRIIELEWPMFHSVNGTDSKVDCQEDMETFRGMRIGQFKVWSDEALRSYEMDLARAQGEGRNLVEEKYIRMMARTDPAGYEAFSSKLPELTVAQPYLADAILEELISQTDELRRKYPNISNASRPFLKEEDTPYETSFETYQHGELLTYSEATLNILAAHIFALKRNGISYAEEVLKNTVRYYGYTSLEQAEAEYASQEFCCCCSD